MKKQDTKKRYAMVRNFTAMGSYLQRLRLDAGLSQSEASRALGYLGPQFISNAEAGICAPAFKLWEAIAKIYGADLQRLADLYIEGQRALTQQVIFGIRIDTFNGRRPRAARKKISKDAAALRKIQSIINSNQIQE